MISLRNLLASSTNFVEARDPSHVDDTNRFLHTVNYNLTIVNFKINLIVSSIFTISKGWSISQDKFGVLGEAKNKR